MPRPPVGVLLVGSDFKALAVARSLGRRGVPVEVVDSLPRSAWFSRYVRRRFRCGAEAMRGPALADFLLEIAALPGAERMLLWPVQDDALEAVARGWERLAPTYQLHTPPWEILRHAHDKALLHGAADAVGVAHPRTWYPADEQALSGLRFDYPLLVKPAVSIDLQRTTGRKALTARDMRELVTAYRVAAGVLPAASIMVQELIPARAQYSVAAFADHGNVTSAMTARRTRQYPIDYGLSSSFVEAIEVPGLIEPARRLIAHLGLDGMVEVEFIEDARDQLPKLIDVNPRPWGWHGLCMTCGLDFPAMTYEHAMGRPTPRLDARYGPRWVRLLTDVPAGIQSVRAGALSPISYARSLFGRETVGSVFDWRDPVPAGGDLAVAALRICRSIVAGKGLHIESGVRPTRAAS